MFVILYLRRNRLTNQGWQMIPHLHIDKAKALRDLEIYRQNCHPENPAEYKLHKLSEVKEKTK